MKRSQVYQAVTSAINTVQSASGYSSQVSGNTCPIGGLQGFDSMTATEVAVHVSVSIGCETPDMKLFFKSPGNPRTVDEIVDVLCDIVEKSESA